MTPINTLLSRIKNMADRGFRDYFVNAIVESSLKLEAHALDQRRACGWTALSWRTRSCAYWLCLFAALVGLACVAFMIHGVR
jgi:hypothetical protein